MRKTKEQAFQDLADYLAEIAEIVLPLTPREAAERIWRPGGPSVEELTDQIIAADAAGSAESGGAARSSAGGPVAQASSQGDEQGA